MPLTKRTARAAIPACAAMPQIQQAGEPVWAVGVGGCGCGPAGNAQGSTTHVARGPGRRAGRTCVVHLGHGQVQVLVEGVHHTLRLLVPQQAVVHKHTVQAVAQDLRGRGGVGVGVGVGGWGWCGHAATALTMKAHQKGAACNPRRLGRRGSRRSAARRCRAPAGSRRSAARRYRAPAGKPRPALLGGAVHGSCAGCASRCSWLRTRCTRVAATVESTPPDSAQMTWSVGPTWHRQREHASEGHMFPAYASEQATLLGRDCRGQGGSGRRGCLWAEREQGCWGPQGRCAP